jgi:hypothetical protein
MKPHPRIRKTIKWGGAAVTLLLIVVWIGSALHGSGWLAVTGSFFWIERGHFVFGFDHSYADSDIKGWRFVPAEQPWGWWWNLESAPGTWVLTTPLWFPALLCLSVAGVAWRLDTLARRRVRLNLCPKCNYDRAGIAKDAVCPECGAKAL